MRSLWGLFRESREPPSDDERVERPDHLVPLTQNDVQHCGFVVCLCPISTYSTDTKVRQNRRRIRRPRLVLNMEIHTEVAR